MKRSIRDKILALNVSALLLCTILIGGVALFYTNSFIESNTSVHLKDITEKEAARIASSFESIEQYVKTLNYVVLENIESESVLTNDSSREIHTQENLNFIHSTIKNVSGAVAVYLRYNPKLTPPTSGIFMAKTDKDHEIQKQTPTDFSKYDPDDVEHVGWYYIPVKSGKSLWMDPYENKNVDIYMISYVVPLFKFNKEIGVIGVDIDFGYLTSKIADIHPFQSGYAYLEYADGKVAYHPHLKMGETFTDTIGYKLARAPLPNGMNLVMMTSEKELNAAKEGLATRISGFALVVVALFALLSVVSARSITRPLIKLTKAAHKMTAGDLNVSFDTDCKDEIGELSKSFSAAQAYIKKYLDHVQGVAYRDSLTNVRNKTAYDKFMHDFANKLERGEVKHFGIVALDVNNLKKVNDNFGHDRGNELLQNACNLVCKTFVHSPVFRVGGDEFIVVLVNNDYENRENLLTLLKVNMAQSEIFSNDPWEQISIAAGLADYIVGEDTISDVEKRADSAMYKNKKEMKAER